jgi:hypothetical protein
MNALWMFGKNSCMNEWSRIFSNATDIADVI